jgi:UPF0755 protein
VLLLLALLVVTVLAVGALVGVGYGISRIFTGGSADYSGGGSGSVVVQVQTGDSAGNIASTLHDSDVVRSTGAFTDAAAGDQRSRAIEPGYYRLRHQMSGKAALAALLTPANHLRTKVTIPEGFRLQQIVQRMAARTDVKLAALQQAIATPLALGLPDYAQGHLEGFLFPATYDIEPGHSAGEALTQLTAAFQVVAARVGLVDGASARGLSPLQVVTVASLVQAEAAPADFTKVAEVVYNRLHAHVALRLEATERYALGFPASANLTRSQLAKAAASAYSTYGRVGLPAGPIDNPGEAALTAALRPATGDLFYYLTLPKTHETRFFARSDQAGFLAAVGECRAQGGCGG